MNRCETCKHWTDAWGLWVEELYEEAEARGESFNPDEAPPRWGTCSVVTLGWDAEQRAFVQDGSDYRADLHTRADFGCVLWTPSP